MRVWVLFGIGGVIAQAIINALVIAWLAGVICIH